jgi:hypothetical protein
VGFDFYAAFVACEPVTVAAPRPVVGGFDQFPADGVAVEVAELFTELAVGEDVEVVIAALPELDAVALEALGGFALEDAEGVLKALPFGFGEEEMDVLRHEDVAEEVEVVFLAEPFELLFEDGAGGVVVKIRETAITTEGDEVEVVVSVESF